MRSYVMPYKNKEDQAAAARRHYDRNKAKIKARAVEQKRVALLRNLRFVHDYLSRNPCVDCGETDPVVLQFDHRDDVVKTINVSDARRRCWSLKRLSSEIAKCEVRCANCHARRTARQFDWYGALDQG